MKVLGIVSPDVAPLTTVKRRLVVFALELGTYGDTSIWVSWPSINNLFSLIFCHPHIIFSTRHFRHNSGHQFTFLGFKHSPRALSQCRLGVSHFHVKRFKFTLAMSCAYVFSLFLHQSFSLESYISIFSHFPYWICLYVASTLSPPHFHKLI